jgi:protein-tyrosine phosphatase
MQPDWIDLDGTANTRDVGGLPTTDGRRTLSRRLLRSDNLQDLSAKDVRRLVDDLGVRTVADLRADIEVRAGGPGPMTREPLVAVEQLSLFPERSRAAAGEVPDVPPWEKRPVTGRGFSGLYLGFLAERADSVLAALRMIAYREGATLVHCTAGKDRTGTVVALALADAGVEREAIVADYAASADHFDELMKRLGASTGTRELALAAAVRHRPKAITMERFLDALTEEAGGVQPWLTAHGWTEEDHAALQHKLLPSPVIVTRTVSPGVSQRGLAMPTATPPGVPVVMMSPGRSVVVLLSHSMIPKGLFGRTEASLGQGNQVAWRGRDGDRLGQLPEEREHAAEGRDVGDGGDPSLAISDVNGRTGSPTSTPGISFPREPCS